MRRWHRRGTLFSFAVVPPLLTDEIDSVRLSLSLFLSNCPCSACSRRVCDFDDAPRLGVLAAGETACAFSLAHVSVRSSLDPDVTTGRTFAATPRRGDRQLLLVSNDNDCDAASDGRAQVAVGCGGFTRAATHHRSLFIRWPCRVPATLIIRSV